MKSALCERFGIEFPPFACTHCRDAVVGMTNAGGVCVRGAVAHTPAPRSLPPTTSAKLSA